jgi:c-di-GMP-binding flagellar brake protein YcgR
VIPGLVEATERRRLERKALRCNAWLRRGGGAPVAVRTLDLNAGGIGLVAEFNPNRGEACRVLLASPSQPRGAAAIEIDATVVHSILNSREGAFTVGLRFATLSAEQSRVVAQYLRGTSN